jgi:predicted RecB family nuclease
MTWDRSGCPFTRVTRSGGVALQDGRWHGYADFLTRVPGDSTLGDFHYEPVDTKLSSSAKPKHALQLAVYSRLVAGEQEQGQLTRDITAVQIGLIRA